MVEHVSVEGGDTDYLSSPPQLPFHPISLAETGPFVENVLRHTLFDRLEELAVRQKSLCSLFHLLKGVQKSSFGEGNLDYFAVQSRSTRYAWRPKVAALCAPSQKTR